MNDFRPSSLRRDQLAKFLPDQESIKEFERLFRVTGELTPEAITELNRLIEETFIDAGSAEAKAQQAIDAINRMANSLEVLSQMPPQTKENFQKLDYIRFDRFGNNPQEVGIIEWYEDDDTLNIHHSGGVVQQVGLETYGRVENSTGSSFANGDVIGFAGVGTDKIIKGQKFIADGSVTSLYILGIATQDIADTGKGRVTTWGHVRDIDTTGTPYGETWLLGDILYASPTVAGGLTNIKPTAPVLVIPMAVTTSINATIGTIFVRTTVVQSIHYGTFVDTTDQTAAAINTAYPITFNTTKTADGIYVGAPTSRIYFENAGLYNLKFSAQVTSTSASTKTLWFFPSINGTAVPDSAMKMSISNNNFTALISRSVSMSFNAGDYLEATWATDDTTITLEAAPATAFAPATPSVILAIHEITQ